MDELNEGQTLADVIDLSRATKVVLDKDRVSPLRRLWCLYEIGSTPMDKVCHYMTQPLVELYRGCMVVLKVS